MITCLIHAIHVSVRRNNVKNVSLYSFIEILVFATPHLPFSCKLFVLNINACRVLYLYYIIDVVRYSPIRNNEISIMSFIILIRACDDPVLKCFLQPIVSLCM